MACFISSCEREMEDLEPARFPTNGAVFIDGFSGGLEYAAFGGSKPTAFDVDNEISFEGTSSMRYAVPDFEDPEGAYAGGSYFTSGARDLSGYTALSFWAKASKSATIDVIGYGNDLGENRFQTAINGLEVNTNWQQYYVPIPDPAKLTEEKGMFFYSEGPEGGDGYTFWVDEVRFENIGTIRPVEASIFNGDDRVVTAEAGTTFTPEAAAVFNLPTGVNQEISTSPAFFTYISSNPSVASVDEAGVITVGDAGEATITALMGDLEVDGSITITSIGVVLRPLQAAPVPTFPADEVISIYSDAYTNEPVDFYNGFWQFSTTQSEVFEVENSSVIRYTDLNFVGIQFTSPTIDVSSTDRFRIDIWTPIPIDASTNFKVLLFDLGPNNSFGGNDDTSHELTFTAPQLESESWVTIDLPLSAFTGLTGRSNLAQIVLSGNNLPTVYVDNIIFYQGD